jgi:hypothetical protein
MSTDRNPMSDKELWRSLAQGDVPGREGAPEAISDLDLAAWLEGRLPEAAAARVEAALSMDGDLRLATLELADILGKPLPAAPARLDVRAKALVGFEVERPARQGLFDWLLAGGRRFAVQRAMALTAAVMIAISGFMMGGGLGESLAQERYVSTATAASTNSNDLSSEFLGSDGI